MEFSSFGRSHYISRFSRFHNHSPYVIILSYFVLPVASLEDVCDGPTSPSLQPYPFSVVGEPYRTPQKLPPLFSVLHCSLGHSGLQAWEMETCPYHFRLRLFTMVRSSCAPIACWILARTSSLATRWYLCTRYVVSCGSASFPWLLFFFAALQWVFMIYSRQEDGCESYIT